MIQKKKVTLDGLTLYRIWDSEPFKIRCEQDGNIYQIAYVTLNSGRTFTTTNIPIEHQYYVEAKDVLNLSADVLAIISANNEFVVDVLDGTRDYEADIDAGGAV